MLDQKEFADKIGEFRNTISTLTDVDEPARLAETAADLKRLNYTPPVSVPVPTFLSYTTADMLAEIERIVDLPDAQVPELPGHEELSPMEIKLEHIAILVFYFKELAALRRGVGEAWDEVDELYVHD